MANVASSAIIGKIEFRNDPREVDQVVAGLNWLRTCDVPVVPLTGHLRGTEIMVPIVIKLGRKDAEEEARIAEKNISSVLDHARVAVRTIRVTASDPDSMRMAAIAAGFDSPRTLTAADLLPADIGGDPFEGLVGMRAQVELARRISHTSKAFGRGALESLSMVLLGNSGCGKTELARRISRQFALDGVTNGTFHEAAAPELISNHVGETPRNVKAAFARADGGVLFIDEAYALSDDCEGSNSFGKEAVNALTLLMDSYRDRVVVIAAGYPKPMSGFLSANPGLRDRFGFVAHVDDFTNAELGDIFKTFAAKRGFRVDDELDAALPEACAELAKLDDFAGARTVRNLFGASVLASADNGRTEKVITREDLERALRESLDSRKFGGKAPMGFA